MAKRLRVYLCHANEDKPTIREIYKRLRGEAWILPWFDEESLLAGQDREYETSKALKTAHLIIVCLSKKSVKREGFIQKEIRNALDTSNEKLMGAIFIIPLRLDNCKMPVELKRLEPLNYFVSGSYERLLQSIKSRAKSLRVKTDTNTSGRGANSRLGAPKDNSLQTVATQSGSSSDLSQNQQKIINNYENAVFISYAWGDASEQMVDELEKAFAERSIPIIRDKKDLDYKSSIKLFEQRIGNGQCIILVISDKYLCSEHCMYELVEIDKNQGLRERIFPIVLADAHIYKAVDRLIYIKYWEEKIEQLNQAIKQVNVMTDLVGITADLDKYARIRTNFDHLIDLLSDMNALTPEMHTGDRFSTLINLVEQEMGGKQVVSQSDAISDNIPEQLLENYQSSDQVLFITLQVELILDLEPQYIDRVVLFVLSKKLGVDEQNIGIKHVEVIEGSEKIIIELHERATRDLELLVQNNDPDLYDLLRLKEFRVLDKPTLPFLMKGQS